MIRTIFFATTCIAVSLVAKGQNKTQDRTIPPPQQQPILTLHAKGSQIYSCKRAGKSFQWVFVAPVARLFNDAEEEVATHGDGPVWNYQDGSSIHGVLQANSSSPEADSIPWLLLKAVNPGRNGILAKVDFIRRSDTHGGVAPTTGCDADHVDASTRIPYTATYTFYSAKP